MREKLDIDDSRAAAVLETPRQRRILLLLVERARSTSELSRLVHAPLNLLHHHLRKFVALGLVRIEREEARAGSPVKFYRATARSFFVPAELMKELPGARQDLQLRESLARSFALSLQGTVYFHDGQGPRMRLVRKPDRRTTTAELWLELHLSEAAASALEQELRALLHRFESRPGRGSRRYLVHAAITPLS
jgi:hypothetical protein